MEYWAKSFASAGGDGSESSPWDTLSDVKANEGLIVPGDVLHLHGSFNETIVFSRSGTPSNPITIYLEDQADIDGSGYTVDIDSVFEIDADDVRLLGRPGYRGTVHSASYIRTVNPQPLGVNVRIRNRLRCEVGHINVNDSNFGGMNLNSAGYAWVHDCSALNNAAKGMVFAAADNLPDNMLGMLVEGVYAEGNGRFGFQFGGGNGERNGGVNRATGLFSKGNGAGFDFEDADDWIVENFRAESNNLTGEGGENNTGIKLSNGKNMIVRHFEVIDNSGAGILLETNNSGTSSDSLNNITGLRLYGGRIEKSGSGRIIDGALNVVTSDNWIFANELLAGEVYNPSEMVLLTACTGGRFANNLLTGGPVGVQLTVQNGNQPNGWTFNNNVYWGLGNEAIDMGAGVTVYEIAGETFVNMSGTLVGIGPTSYTGSNISNLDAMARVYNGEHLHNQRPRFDIGHGRGVFIPGLHDAYLNASNPPGAGAPASNDEWFAYRRRLQARRR